ncbi:MAG: hypothetical protein HY976_03395 [Candidatus Kerfeldbacteria bacterium]|nr:hypothetical protein [Candidatus Kerfeldbacteria bacterium]
MTPPAPAGAESKSNRTEVRVRRYLQIGAYAAAAATLAFNKPLNRAFRRTMIDVQVNFTRSTGYLGEEIADAIKMGWFMLEFKWVGLALMNLGLYMFLPNWSWIHVLTNFAFLLVVKHVEKVYLLHRILAIIAGAGAVGFFKGLDKSSLKAVWSSFGQALEQSGGTASAATLRIVRTLQNEGHYFTIGAFVGAFGMFGASGLPWVTVPLAAICSLLLWELSTSVGNNRDASGRSVVQTAGGQALTYKVYDPETKAVVDGYKFTLPWFQMKTQVVAASLIAACVLFSWGSAFVYRSDADRDGLSNYEERVVHRTDWQKADTDGDEISDREEIVRGLDPRKPLNAMIVTSSTGMLWWKKTAVDTVAGDPNAKLSREQFLRDKAAADSVRAIITNPMKWGSVLPKGTVGPIEARWATPDSLPPRSLERADAFIGNVWNTMKWNSSNGRTFMEYLLWIGIAIAIAVFGAKRKNAWARIPYWVLAVWVFASTSGIPGALSVIVAIGLMFAIFGFFGPKESGQATAHGH